MTKTRTREELDFCLSMYLKNDLSMSYMAVLDFAFFIGAVSGTEYKYLVRAFGKGWCA